VFLLVVLTTTAVTFILPQSFRSTVRIEVGKDATDIAPILMGVQNPNTYDPYFIQTEFEKIRSKTVLHKVIEELNLNELWAPKYGSEGKLKTSETFSILLRQVDVRQARNTSLIEIQVYSEDPKEAAEIANKIAHVYKDTRKGRSHTASKESIAILKDKLAEQKTLLEAAEKRMDELRMELGVADIDGGALVSTVEPEIVRMFERARAEVQVKLANFESLWNQLTNKPLDQLANAIPNLSYPDARLTEILTQIGMTETSRTQLTQELGPVHAKVTAVNGMLAELRKQLEARVTGLLTQIQMEVNRNREQVASLTNMVSESRKTDAKMMEKYRPYFAAKRDYDTKLRIYETINLRVLQEGIDAALPKSSIVEITDNAEAAVRPVRPNIPLNIALGVVVGLLMGFGLAFFIEYLDTSVKTIDDVERALQAPVLGVIPQNVGALIQEGPDSPHAEAYRVLRTNLLFSRKDPNANSLTVVSGGAGEGKSTTIFNLATVFAQHGHRVLIVDSDLRRPSLHKLLNVSNAIGLTNYLLKQNTLEEVIQTTALPTLYFLPSGKLPSSSLGILNSPQMKEFIRQAKERFDFVFFDSPPIMGVSDASVLASEVDVSLLVIQYRKYPQAMTIRAKQMVEKVGGTLLGVVLNNINISQDSYYYYYSGYYYDYYSKHDDETSSSKKNGETNRVASERADLDLKKKY
ncbi:MAG: polysaccharide biosynthesis tyrosine autokinase, partial [Verrucomicrobiales bacterium]|nr:polysaccharide biosynthesis tyrosine autokinase [Verrucomicrobiales bacterium]